MESNEQNKLRNKTETDMDTWKTDSCQKGGRGEDWMKEGDRISQRTSLHKPQTQTTVGDDGHREVGARVGWRWAKEGEMGISLIV